MARNRLAQQQAVATPRQQGAQASASGSLANATLPGDAPVRPPTWHYTDKAPQQEL